MNQTDVRKTILIIDLDANSNRSLSPLLNEIQDVEVQVESRDMEKGIPLIRKFHPVLVILNLYPSEDPGLEFAKKITRNFPGITLFVTARKMSSTVILNAMRAGAREFLIQPINKDELITAVKKTLQAQKEPSSDPWSRGKMITVFGTKGGVGTTMIAANVASSLARHTKTNVVVVDLNFQFGDTALQLDVKTRYSILDVANHFDQIDLSLFRDMLPKGSDGVSLLNGPLQIEEAESITGNHVENILTMLRNSFDYTIIDTTHVLDDVTVKAMDESDHVLLIAELDVPTIYNTTRCLELFQKMGYDREKVLLVLNRYDLLDKMELMAMENLLNYPIFWRLPNQDFHSMMSSINTGVPISKMMPNSKLSQNLFEMAKMFNGSVAAKPTRPEKHPKLGLLQKIIK